MNGVSVLLSGPVHCFVLSLRIPPASLVDIQDWFGEGPEPLPLETPAQVKQFATRPR
jgi:hypothetical protein